MNRTIHFPSLVRSGFLGAALGLAPVSGTNAGGIVFDEFGAQNSGGTIPSAAYAEWGVSFDGSDDGSTWVGLSLGDPGGWGVEGTEGSAFSAYNGASYANRLTFDRTVRSFTLDATRTGGSQAGDAFTLEGWKDGSLVETRNVTLDGINAWQSVALFSAVDEVRWSGAGAGFHPFAVDNLRWTNEYTKRIIFDEYAPANAGGAIAGDYSALGVTVSGTDDGSTWAGLALGDPGGWGVDGSDGTVFSAYNGASYGASVSFDTDVANVAIEATRTGGSNATDGFVLEGWRDGLLVETQSLAFGAVDQWKMVTLGETVDELRWTGTGAGFHPFAVDNLTWTEPGAGVLRFDEAPADNANGTIAADRYADLGIHFLGTDDGSTWEGLGLGDPGGWDLEGTAGSIFAAFNGGSNALTMLFDGTISDFSLDVARAAGSSAGDGFTLEGWLDGVLIDSRSVLLPETGTWLDFALGGTFDEMRLFGTTPGFHPFGIDNVNWYWESRDGPGPGTVPLPAGLYLLGTGLAVLLASSRRLRARTRGWHSPSP